MSDEILTAKHWTPDTVDDWNAEGDLRDRVMADLRLFAAGTKNPFEIRPAMVTDPEDPMPCAVLAANWFHADIHGVMTRDIFLEDLRFCIAALAEMIVEDRNPFFPIRIYKDVVPAYGVGVFDFRGDSHAFDLRTIVQFGSWEFTTDKGEKVTSAGYQFHVSTLCVPDKTDVDVHVGRDMAKYFDEVNGIG